MNLPVVVHAVSVVASVGVIGYAAWLYRTLDGGETVASVALYTGASVFVFAAHHLGELLLSEVALGRTISEGIEGASVLLLGMAVLSMYNHIMIEA